MALGSIIGSAVGAAASIAGGIAASRTMNKAQRRLETQMRENQDWYDRRYNEDATQRADAQRLLTMTEESIKRRNRQAAGAAAVMGGTPEAVAAEKQANSEALASATGQIAAAADARKAAIDNQYLETKAGLNAQMNGMTLAKAQAITEATKGVREAAGQLGQLGQI